jgi:hypothetical protein
MQVVSAVSLAARYSMGHRQSASATTGSSQPSRQPKSAKLAAKRVVVEGRPWTSVDGRPDLETNEDWLLEL